MSSRSPKREPRKFDRWRMRLDEFSHWFDSLVEAGTRLVVFVGFLGLIGVVVYLAVTG